MVSMIKNGSSVRVAGTSIGFWCTIRESLSISTAEGVVVVSFATIGAVLNIGNVSMQKMTMLNRMTNTLKKNKKEWLAGVVTIT